MHHVRWRPRITGLRERFERAASTPPEAEKVKEAAYALLPTSKVTDVLLDVDSGTGFTACFTHQRHGRPPDNKPALLSAILADGINLGLYRMVDAIRGVT